MITALAAGIDRCETYQAVAGKVLFSGGSGPVLASHSLASRLFSKGVRWGDDIAGAADWLICLMTTRETTALFKAAIWGLEVGTDVLVSENIRITPFANLPDSYMRGRLVERARPCHDGSAWIAQNYFDVPSAAYVEQVDRFPYIRGDNASFLEMNDLVWRLHELSIVAQAACVGQPLAVAAWFEYADRDLEFSEWENTYTWLLPEVHPHVKRAALADSDLIRTSLGNYDGLAEEQRALLFRSMERFRLSQTRRDDVDRVLDLALALEIAVSEKGDNASPSWKVSVRAAQMIGGTLAARQQTRADISSLYELRNQATHGGALKAKSQKSVRQIVEESCEIYVKLVRRLLSIREKPNWKLLELGPDAAI
jgi:Apea-like HEPN